MITGILLIAFLATLLSITLLLPLSRRLSLLDVPGGRKEHQGSIPLIGGVGMLISLGFSCLFLPISLSDYRSLMAGALVLVFVGVLDDYHELSAYSRFLGQIVAALLMVLWGGYVLVHLGDLLGMGAVELPYGVALVLTVIATVGVINAVNMTDGMDGFAGSLVFIELVCLCVLAMLAHRENDVYMISLIMAVLLGFLVFNFPLFAPARVFMGDAGSMLLGFFVVWLLVKFSQGPQAFLSPIVGLWVMAVPLYETGCAIIRRLLRQQSPFSPDTSHAHHVLLRLGLSPLSIIVIMSSLSLVMGGVGIYANEQHANETYLFLGFMLLFFVYLAIFSYLSKWVTTGNQAWQSN